VCGFKSTIPVLDHPEVDGKKSDRILPFDTIMITQGAGVTTDGDLITLRQKGNFIRGFHRLHIQKLQILQRV
jgi:hypothetical protein